MKAPRAAQTLIHRNGPKMSMYIRKNETFVNNRATSVSTELRYSGYRSQSFVETSRISTYNKEVQAQDVWDIDIPLVNTDFAVLHACNICFS